MNWDIFYTYALAFGALCVAVENILKLVVKAVKGVMKPVDKAEKRIQSMETNISDHEVRITAVEMLDIKKGMHDLRHRVDRLEENQTSDHNSMVMMQQGINILLKCQLDRPDMDDERRKEITDYVVNK